MPGSIWSGLDVAGDRLAVAEEDDLERRVGLVALGVVHDHAEMWRPREGERLGCRRGELDAGQIDPGRGTGDLAEVDAVDEERSEDVHEVGGSSVTPAGRSLGPADELRLLQPDADEPDLAPEPDERPRRIELALAESHGGRRGCRVVVVVEALAARDQRQPLQVGRPSSDTGRLPKVCPMAFTAELSWM